MKQLGLKRVLILSVILLVGFSVSISSLVTYLQEKETLTEIINAKSETYVDLKASIIETLINEKVAGINKLANQFQNKKIKGNDDELIERVHFLANAMNLGVQHWRFKMEELTGTKSIKIGLVGNIQKMSLLGHGINLVGILQT